MKTIFNRAFFIIPAVILALVFAGCENTGEGIGEDMQEAGEAIEDTVEDAKD